MCCGRAGMVEEHVKYGTDATDGAPDDETNEIRCSLKVE